MAKAFENNKITSQQIGGKLSNNYPPDNNDSINYFWVTVSRKDDDFDQVLLDRVAKKYFDKSTVIDKWAKLMDNVQDGKLTMYFVMCKKDGKNEREKEMALNTEIRQQIKEEMKMKWLSIIIMRACSYACAQDSLR